MKKKFNKSNNLNIFITIVFLSIFFDLIKIIREYHPLLQYFYDCITILKIRISDYLHFESETYSLLIYFLMLYLFSTLVGNLINFFLSIYIISDIFLNTFLLLVSIYLYTFILNLPRFPLTILLPVILSIFFINKFIFNYLNINKKYITFLVAVCFLLWNFLLMNLNLKDDSVSFEYLFGNNRYLISSRLVKIDVDDFKYYSLNCCSSENYIESGYKPGSFLNLWEDSIFMTTGNGELYVFEKEKLYKSVIKIKKIKSNFFDFVDQNRFQDQNMISVRGSTINNNIIYVSYINEVYNNCFNLAVLNGNLNNSYIEFTKFFEFDDCILVSDLGNSQLHSSSGAMVVNKNYLYIAIGEFLESTKAQSSENLFGKIIKINLNNMSTEIVSIGHRNIQGMEIFENSILAVEHGPAGGDELNQIKLNFNDIQNFGWPISSYGEHYDGQFYEDMPLLKSHKDYGFIEPKFYFTPSIGISDIKVFRDKFIISSMRAGRLYILSNDDFGNVESQPFLNINHRIREQLFFDNKLLLYLEDLSGIVLIDLED